MSASSDTLATDGKPTTRASETRPYTPPATATASADPEVDALRAVIALDRDAQLRVVEFVASRNGKRVASKRAGSDGE